MNVSYFIACIFLGSFTLCNGFFLDSIFKTTTTRKPFVYQPGVLDPAAAIKCPKHLNRTKTLMYNTYTKHCFTINIAKTADWYTAKADCERLGGYLARLRDFSDNMFVGFRVHGALQYPHKHIWIGLSDTGKKGVYRWTNGASLNFSNWALGEPSRVPWQNCVAYNRDIDRWDNRDCYLKYAWVCQFDDDAKPVTIPVTTTIPSTPPSTASSRIPTSKPTTIKPSTTTPVPTTVTPSTKKPSTTAPTPTTVSTTPSTSRTVSTTHHTASTFPPRPASTRIPVTTTKEPRTPRFPGYEIIG